MNISINTAIFFICSMLSSCASSKFAQVNKNNPLDHVGIISLMPEKAKFIHIESLKEGVGVKSKDVSTSEKMLTRLPNEISSLYLNYSSKRTYDLQSIPYNLMDSLKLNLQTSNQNQENTEINIKKLHPLLKKLKKHTKLNSLLIITPRVSMMEQMQIPLVGHGVLFLKSETQGYKNAHLFLAYKLFLIDVINEKLVASTQDGGTPSFMRQVNYSLWKNSESLGLKKNESKLHSAIAAEYSKSIVNNLHKLEAKRALSSVDSQTAP